VILDKKAIKNIALDRFHDKEYASLFDLTIHAVEIWLKENKLEIKAVTGENREVDSSPGPK
jgi:hypothetical protein